MQILISPYMYTLNVRIVISMYRVIVVSADPNLMSVHEFGGCGYDDGFAIPFCVFVYVSCVIESLQPAHSLRGSAMRACVLLLASQAIIHGQTAQSPSKLSFAHLGSFEGSSHLVRFDKIARLHCLPVFVKYSVRPDLNCSLHSMFDVVSFEPRCLRSQ